MRARLLVTAAAIIAAAAALASTATSGGNRAADITCGAEITTSITLHQDLTCAGDGLIIDTPNPVTVNLNGHTIRGPGGTSSFSTTGLQLFGSPVTVKNGTITGFGTGISGFGGSDTLSRLTVSRNYLGIGLNSDLLLTDSKIVDNAQLGAADDGNDCPNFLCSADVRRTTFARNGGDGLFFGQTVLWSVTDSQFIANGRDGLSVDDSFGAVSNSVASHNRGDGIHVFISSSFNLQPTDPGPTVSNNTATGNGNWGIEYTVFDGGADFPRTVPAEFGVNIARNNGQPGQCLGIVCVPSA